MKNLKIDDLLPRPRRILVERDGTAESCRRAATDYGITEVAAVFVRDDGWSLGVPSIFIPIAREMWAGTWEHVITSEGIVPIEEF